MPPSELFEMILAKPGMYVTGRSVTEIASYINGYLASQWELGVRDETDIYFGFQQWVEDRFNLEVSRGWQHIISFMSHDDAEAFETTRDLWQEYKLQLQRK